MRFRHRTHFALAACLGLAAAALLAPGNAAAATGDLTFAGCIADAGMAGCSAPSGANRPLRDASGVAVTRDGSSVYVTSRFAGSISHLRRASDGSLAFAGCIANGGAEGCTDPMPGQMPLGAPVDVTVTDDGADVYVASDTDGTANGGVISHFNRAANGDLTFAGCRATGGRHGCADPSGAGRAPLAGASSVAVHPDGNLILVASRTAGSVALLGRNADGSLNAVLSCWANDTTNGCQVPPTELPFAGVDSIAVSRDGGHQYVAGRDAISHFVFDSNLLRWSYAGCVADGGAGGCDDPLPGSHPLRGPSDVALSPNGADLYASASVTNSIAQFRLDALGHPIFAACLKGGGGDGCSNVYPGHNPLHASNALAMSADGRSVFVLSPTADAISHLRRSSNGSLAFAGCIAGAGAEGCTDPSSAGNPMDMPSDLAVSPTDTDVYLTSGLAESISHLRREPEPPRVPTPPAAGDPASPGEPAPEDPGPTADTTAPETRIDRVRPRRRVDGITVRFSSDEQGSTFVCKLDRGRWRACASPKTYRRLDDGRHKVKVRAIDPAGNRDPSPARERVQVR